MGAKAEKYIAMISQIDAIIQKAREAEISNAEALNKVHPDFQSSALNLIHYRAMRSMDITDLQKKLGYLGITRLAKSEGHIMASLLSAKLLLHKLMDDVYYTRQKPEITIKKGLKILQSHTQELFGYRSKGRRVRIMVTIPTEAAHHPKMVEEMLAAGMNCARINCAHDGPEVWKKMIDNIRKASKKLKRSCKISMDLGGPKIRTGAMVPGPHVRKFQPVRDELGRTTEPSKILLVPELLLDSPAHALPVDEKWLKQLKRGDEIHLVDTRDKERIFKIVKATAKTVEAHCQDTSYLATGTILTVDSSKAQTEVGLMPTMEQSLLLQNGDMMYLHKDPAPGEPAQYDEHGKLVREAHLSCTLPEIFNQVQPGERIFFDDGKIEGKIQEQSEDHLLIKIVHTKAGGVRLRSDKGINLPDSHLTISGLTLKDREDLKFVAEHADVVNMSFVNSAEDVKELLAEIEELGAQGKLGIILKIETQTGFNNLMGILLTAMRTHPVGVMIARGDLAIESGWKNMARVQNEMLKLCSAGHIPNVWATQVLETLAKKGIPSRSEITDAYSSLKAECVMLNKGPHIVEAIKFLDTMLKSMEQYQEKNAPMLPALQLSYE